MAAGRYSGLHGHGHGHGRGHGVRVGVRVGVSHARPATRRPTRRARATQPSEGVKELQELLKETLPDVNLGATGHGHDGVDGIYGRNTHTALQQMLDAAAENAPDEATKKQIEDTKKRVNAKYAALKNGRGVLTANEFKQLAAAVDLAHVAELAKGAPADEAAPARAEPTSVRPAAPPKEGAGFDGLGIDPASGTPRRGTFTDPANTAEANQLTRSPEQKGGSAPVIAASPTARPIAEPLTGEAAALAQEIRDVVTDLAADAAAKKQGYLPEEVRKKANFSKVSELIEPYARAVAAVTTPETATEKARQDFRAIDKQVFEALGGVATRTALKDTLRSVADADEQAKGMKVEDMGSTQLLTAMAVRRQEASTAPAVGSRADAGSGNRPAARGPTP